MTTTIIPSDKPMALLGMKKIEILHTPSHQIDIVDGQVLELAKRMFTTALKNSGYAIAAVQVGFPWNLVVTAQGEAYYNISVVNSGKKMETGIEGCLSIPGRHYAVPRYKKVEFSGTSLGSGKFEFKKLEGFEARLWQHEYDHLQGILVSDNYEEVVHPDREDLGVL